MEAIGELVAALVELVVRSVVAILELSFALMQFVLEALGFSVEVLAAEPAEGESRWSLARLGLAFVPWGLAALVGTGVFGYTSWRASVIEEQIAQTTQIVRQTADQLDTPATADATQGFAPPPAGFVPPKDAWGQTLRIEYEDRATNHVLVVRSGGPDQAMKTLDDVVESRSLSKGKAEAAVNVGKALFEAVRKKRKGE